MTSTLNTVPYKIIADCFRDRSVVPFLGAGASFVGAPEGEALPSGPALARLLVEQSDYPGALTDPLTKVAQYLEEIPSDRDYILTTLSRRFVEQVNSEYQSALTQFLDQIPAQTIPELIITTNYDVLVEGALEKRGLPYMAISHIMKGSKYAGRLLCSRSLSTPLDDSNIQTRKQIENELSDLEGKGSRPTLIYKMNGTARLRCGGALLDSVVLTENDYIEFLAQDILNRIPGRILDLLRTNRLLFLGYSLEDWNFRVLLRRLQMFQRRENDSTHRHWAFLLGADDVEVKFWERRGVNLYQKSLDIVLSNLRQNIA
jgi:hypothetical protein